MVQVLAWRVPPFDNGCYLLLGARGEAVVVDPSMGERTIMDAARERGLKLLEILNTHGHPDHVYGDAALKSATGARLAIHRLDAYRLGPARPAAQIEAPIADADDLIDEGTLRFLPDVRMEALHTPGHTEGSTCFYLPDDGVLFSGDVLFQGNVGRVDLPGGDARAMEASLARVATLPPATRVYPGHGPQTTIDAELRWLRGFRFA